MMLCKSYFTYEHYDFKHVLFDSSVFGSVLRTQALRGWCFFYVCALDAWLWDGKFVLFVVQNIYNGELT